MIDIVERYLMSAGWRLRSLIRNLRHGRTLNRELDKELQGAIDELAERHLRRGMTPDRARRLARLDVGGLPHVREQVRDSRTGASLERLATDVRYALRALGKSPAVCAAVIGTFALGIAPTPPSSAF